MPPPVGGAAPVEVLAFASFSGDDDGSPDPRSTPLLRDGLNGGTVLTFVFFFCNKRERIRLMRANLLRRRVLDREPTNLL